MQTSIPWWMKGRFVDSELEGYQVGMKGKIDLKILGKGAGEMYGLPGARHRKGTFSLFF